jgi:uncharacterized membrane protein YvbJ
MVEYERNKMTKRKCFRCGTEVEKNAVYCPECGVNIDQYFKDNKKTLLLGKKPEDSIVPNEKPKIGTGTIIGLVILTILIFPLGIVVSLLVLWGHRKAVEDWQMERLIAKQN